MVADRRIRNNPKLVMFIENSKNQYHLLEYQRNKMKSGSISNAEKEMIT